MSAIKNLKFMQRAQSICDTKLLKMHVYVNVNMYNVILTIFFLIVSQEQYTQKFFFNRAF